MKINVGSIGTLLLIVLLGAHPATANSWALDDYGFLVDQRGSRTRGGARPRIISRLFQRRTQPCPNIGVVGEVVGRNTRSATAISVSVTERRDLLPNANPSNSPSDAFANRANLAVDVGQ